MSLKSFLQNYPIVTVGLLIWVMGLVTFATIEVFTGMNVVSGPVATCYTALVGLPSIAVGLYRSRFMNGKKTNLDE